MREAVRLGDKFAIQFFESAPPFPDEIEYLYDWIKRLHGRSGSGFGTAARLSPTVAKDFFQAMDIHHIHPLEYEALFYLDDVMIDYANEQAEKRSKEKKKPPKPSMR